MGARSASGPFDRRPVEVTLTDETIARLAAAVAKGYAGPGRSDELAHRDDCLRHIEATHERLDRLAGQVSLLAGESRDEIRQAVDLAGKGLDIGFLRLALSGDPSHATRDVARLDGDEAVSHDDSSSVVPGAGTPGRRPTVEATPDAPGVNSSTGRVGEAGGVR